MRVRRAQARLSQANTPTTNMTNPPNIKNPISQALAQTRDAPRFADAAMRLLNELGYQSRLTPPDQPEDPALWLSKTSDTRTKRDFLQSAASMRVLFQITDSEIRSGAETQATFGDLFGFNEGNARSFLFAAVDLSGARHPRGRLAAFAREINKAFPMPCGVIFRASDGRLSFAFAHRRRNLRHADRDVIGAVSLIREIDPVNTHRAHLDILSELSLGERLKWMDSRGKSRNFDGLLDAWLAALDTETLNKAFYKDLFGWFQRAVRDAKFPADKPEITPEEHAIRLITRMLFVWFVKEKGLVDENLFIEKQVKPLLRDYDRVSGDSYYRAVLQNLFFATLNTEIGERDFSNVDDAGHRDFSKYRYRDLMADSDALIRMFERTPFINGGLFDCLDSFEGYKERGYRIDCFTDRIAQRRKLSVPNRLFFDEKGLIPLFERYKFTVEENTPTETEVALDPELLGKAFENLLAANTPETRDSARKRTGSYYTPRPVVDYMADEALAAAISRKAAPPDAADNEKFQARLRRLFDYSDPFEDDPFNPSERAAIVRAVSQVKILDPAVGSGAFPMGVLHKLTLALRRLDPRNEMWENVQRDLARERAADAFDTDDQDARNAELAEISDTFERYRDSDFGRKLYLIQNSVFGVDIQPIAAQIAKLRFFISLAIEQTPNDNPSENYGIKPLPNLETRFVAANTLIGLESDPQMTLGQTDAVKRLQRELDDNRERHFHAAARSRKLAYREKDRILRQDLARELQRADFSAADAQRIADWDPYDQNATSDWFDPNYMFGIPRGFDIVIGNPPYIQLQRDGGKLGRLYEDAGYQTFARTGDIYQLFYERGCQLLTPASGVLSYITSNSWMRAEYGKKTRRHFSESHTPLKLLEMGKDVFESAIVDTNILILRHGESGEPCAAVDMDNLADKTFPPSEDLWGELRTDGEKPWSALSSVERSIMDKVESAGTPIRDWDVSIYRGVTSGMNDAFVIDDETKRALIAEDPNSAQIIKPVLRGRDIQRYRAQWEKLWTITLFPALELDIENYPAVKRHLLSFGKDRMEQSGKVLPNGVKARKKTSNKWFETADTTAYYGEFAKEKLIWIDLTNRGRFAYDGGDMFCVNTATMMTGQSLKYLCAVLNSDLITWFMGNNALNSGMGATRWIRSTVEKIPIPKIPAAEQVPFAELVDLILTAKSADPRSDTSELESEIDALVHALYSLSADESAAITAGS